MNNSSDIEKVLSEPRIAELLNASRYSVEEMHDILSEYTVNVKEYHAVGKKIMDSLHNCKRAHSVKYRVKSLYSLCKKILIKDVDTRPKINRNTLYIEIGDIIAFRILYVFPEDYYGVYAYIYKKYASEFAEQLCINYNKGDDKSIYDKIDSSRRIFRESEYRSIHYSIYAYIHKSKKIKIEIQTRTIADEIWGEINHKLYKSDVELDPLLQSYMSFLSRLTGIINAFGTIISNAQYDEHDIDYNSTDTDEDDVTYGNDDRESSAHQISEGNSHNEYSYEKIEARLLYWYKRCEVFIKAAGLEGHVEVNQNVLINMVLTYFADISKVKSFHSIGKISKEKFYAYSFYWFLKFKPITILHNAPEHAIYINEKFITSFIVSIYCADTLDDKCHTILPIYLDMLSYFFKYHNPDAHSIEMVLQTLKLFSGP